MDYILGLRPYSNKEVNRAAIQLANQSDQEAFRRAMDVVADWRTWHQGPVARFRTILEYVAGEVDPSSFIATRLKRIPTIIEKLKRQPTMKLSTMQDIGGLRAVVNTVADVRSVREALSRVICTAQTWELAGVKDYIENPAPSGYRGLHLVYRYKGKSELDRSYDGLRIEVQVRTKLQHIWATAVETVGVFRGESLKSGEGDPEWLEFFRLAAEFVAQRERAESARPGQELAALRDKLNVGPRLGLYNVSRQIMEDPELAAHMSSQGGKYAVMVHNMETRAVRVWGFASNLVEAAVQRQREEEERYVNDPTVQTVMVSVDSLEELPQAYPNYFAETRGFVELLYDLPPGSLGV